MSDKGTGKKLRRGFTTGACAAAGAKAAALALFTRARVKSVSVSLPRGGALDIPVKNIRVKGNSAWATIIKDAGDDPDVTNGAEFVTGVEYLGENDKRTSVTLKGGEGVGVVTRPGLKVPIGKPAINPVPQQMIRRAVLEAAKEAGKTPRTVVTVTVPRGAELAEKTMNPRLGIVGGISILGTTGIVEPMSLIAYTHSISCGVDVALASGFEEVVFSTGRSSEKVVEKTLRLPPVSFILTGDHMGYALRDSRGRRGLKRVTVAGQFGKFSKLAAGHFETHCADASVEFEFLARLCREKGALRETIEKVLAANTAREVYFLLKNEGLDIFKDVCALVRDNSAKITGRGVSVRAILVGYENDVAGIA